MSSSAARHRQEMAGLLASEKGVTDRRWIEAVAAVPRELFLGDAVFHPDDGAQGTLWRPVRRDRTDPETWSRMAYADRSWVTQVDGVLAEDATRALPGAPTSSSTLPSLVVKMLERAEIAEGDRVLEIGTGTGYSTGLLCERLGAGQVTSVEFDPAVAARARAALESAGHAPVLIVGDGLTAYDKDAEYDRLIATCSVRYIPAPWIWQVRDGGTITTPLSGWLGGTVLAHLTVEPGGAGGRFLPDELSFMFARPHDRPSRAHYLLRLGEQRETRIAPAVLDDPAARFVAQLGVPSAELLGAGDHVVLLDVATGSQATTEPAPGGGWRVRQHGPLRLWDAAEDAIETWREAGSPPVSAFGLTVTPQGQRVWLGDPGGPSWSLPA
ncbi:ATP-grasp peptide maturase system methyltransferase [Nonomuraea sp. NPDC023979]|uniref:ATP-grasp peptide maturase system methyltransferase n=1 Tax=Nonomuraea sp. NPDC023979 TaxID=3154796 RepID=UPI0033D8A59B